MVDALVVVTAWGTDGRHILFPRDRRRRSARAWRDAALALADEPAAAGGASTPSTSCAEPVAEDGDPDVDRRLTAVRHQAFGERPPATSRRPAADPGGIAASAGTLAEIEPTELTAAVVRRAIEGCGGLLVRGLLADHVDQLVHGIDTAFVARERGLGGDAGLVPPALARTGRGAVARANWVAGGSKPRPATAPVS